MAIEFIRVRRKDDHTVTTTIARSALRLWAGDWEPIPAPDATPERSETAQVTESAQVSEDPEPGDAPDPETKSKRRAAATDTKGEK